MVFIGQSPPATNEIEISLFGPGFGECVVVHLGYNDWIIVDSCRDLASKRPVSLVYLERLGVPVDTAVKRVIATHYHDDHLDGLPEVFGAATSSTFACTAAFQNRDFAELLTNFVGMNLGIAGSGSNHL